MELLVITAVKAFEEKVKNVLETSNVQAYSYNSVIGFRNSKQENDTNNWFGGSLNEVDSLLFFAFVKSNTISKIFEEVDKINLACETKNRIHLAVLPITKHTNH